MNLHLSQSPYSWVCQLMAALLLRICSLDTGASIILLLPEVNASWDGTDKPVIPLGVKVKGTSILGAGTS